MSCSIFQALVMGQRYSMQVMDVFSPKPIRHLTFPPEIWLKIFMYLSLNDKTSVALVCKTWKSLVYDPSLWKNARFRFERFDLRNMTRIVTSLKNRRVRGIRFSSLSGKEVAIRKLLEQSSSFIRHLDFGVSHENLSSVLKSWTIPVFSRLSHLDIRNVSNIDLARLLSAMPLLKKLNANSVNLMQEDGDLVVNTIVKCPGSNLVDLDISFLKLTAEGVKVLFNGNPLPRLKRLSVAITSRLICKLGSIERSMPAIQHLEFRQYNPSSYYRHPGAIEWELPKTLKSLRMAGMPYLPTFSFGILQALDLRENPCVYDITLEQIAAHLPFLEVLMINKCKITDSGANTAVCKLVRLRILFVDHLPLSNMSDFLDNVAHNLSFLRSLSCLGCGLSRNTLRSKFAKSNLKYLRFQSYVEIIQPGAWPTIAHNAYSLGLHYFTPDPSDLYNTTRRYECVYGEDESA